MNEAEHKVRFKKTQCSFKQIEVSHIYSPCKNFEREKHSALGTKYLNLELGLPSNRISHILERKNGEVWALSAGNLYNLQNGRIKAFNSNHGFPMTPFSDLIEYRGKMYLASFGKGLFVFENGNLKQYKVANGFPSNHLLKFTIHNEELFIGTFDKGIIKIDKNETVYSLETSSIIDKFKTVNLLESNSKQLILGGVNGLFYLEGNVLFEKTLNHIDINDINAIESAAGNRLFLAETNRLYEVNSDSIYEIKIPTLKDIKSLIIGKSNAPIISFKNGLIILVSDEEYLEYGEMEGFQNSEVLDVIQDKYSRLWCASKNKGLHLISPSSFSNLEPKMTNIKSLCKGKNDELLYENTNSDGGLVVLKNKIKKYYNHSELKNILRLRYDKKRECYWALTPFNIFQISIESETITKYAFKTDGEDIGNLTHFDITPKGDLVLCAYNYGLVFFDVKSAKVLSKWYEISKTYDLFVKSVGQDSLIVGSFSGKLGLISKSKIKYFDFSKTNLMPLDAAKISKDSIFLATSNGLYLFNDNRVSKFIKNRKINNSRINYIDYDSSEKTFWLGTPRGLIKFDLYENKSVLYNVDFGMVSNSIQSNKVTINNKNYWAVNQGVIVHTPFKFDYLDKKRGLMISQVSLRNSSFEPVDINDESIKYRRIEKNAPVGLSLPNYVNNVKLNIQTNHWGKERLTELKYSLNNSTWLKVEDNGIINLNNLSPNHYTLRVQADYPDAPSELVSYSFEVQQPFYMSLLFIGSLIAVVLIILFFLFRNIDRFSFDKFESYNDGKFLLQKIRVLAISNLLFLIGLDLVFGFYIADNLNIWVYFGVSIFTIIVLFYSYQKKINLRRLSFVFKASYLTMVIVYLFRAFYYDFPIHISSELAITFLFSVFLFRDVKNILFYTSFFLICSILLLNFSSAELSHKLMFLYAILTGSLGAFLFNLIEDKKISKIYFSEKVLSNSNQFIIVSNNKGEIVYCNQYLQDFFNVRESDVLADGWWNLRSLTNKQINATKEDIKSVLKSRKTPKNGYVNEIFIRDKKFSIKWKDTVVEDKYILGIGEDISNTLKQEEELRKLSLVATNVQNGVLFTDINNKIEWANSSFLKLTEYTLQDIIGEKPDVKFSGPKTNYDFATAAKAKEKNSFEVVQYSKGGAELWFLVNINPIYEGDDVVRKVYIYTNITERKKEQDKYKFIVENSGDIIFTSNANGIFTFIGGDLNEILGYSANDLLGKHYESIVYKDDIQELRDVYYSQVSNKTKVTVKEFRAIGSQGQIKWVSQTVKMVYDKNNSFYFQCIVKDIHDVKTKQIEEQKERAELIKQSAFLLELNKINIRTFKNKAEYIDHLLEKLKLFSRVEVISYWESLNNNLACVLTTGDKEKIGKEILSTEYIDFFKALNSNLYIEKANDGDKESDTFDREMHESSSMLYIPIRIDGKVIAMISIQNEKRKKQFKSNLVELHLGVSELITIATQRFENIEYQKNIEESEARFRLINDSIEDVFWLVDLMNKKIDYISPNCYKLTGKKQSEYFEDFRLWESYTHPEDHELIKKTHASIEEEKSKEIEYRIICEESSVKWVKEKLFIIKDEFGNNVKVSGIISDITKQKRTQQEIKQLSLVAEKTVNGVTISDFEGRVIWANESYLKMFEIDFEELKGKQPKLLFNPGEVSFHNEINALKNENKSFNIELATHTFTGKALWVEIKNTIITDNNGDVLQVEVVNDVTQRKLREQLIQRQNKDILSSIRYAQRIQNALLTPTEKIDEFGIDYFLYYTPKDIIGGDFYWAHKIGNHIVFAVGDCTGHGVPGAIMTSLGINGLINAVEEMELKDPALILSYIDNYVLDILSTSASSNVDDGMDMGVILLNIETNEATYSGAGRPLYLEDNGSIERINGSRRSIGSKYLKTDFFNQTVVLSQTASLYLFSDGIVDQFGSINNRKYGSRGAKQTFVEMSGLSIENKKRYFIEEFEKFKTSVDQTDDIVLLCLSLKKS